MKVLIASLCREALSEREFVDPVVRIVQKEGHEAERAHFTSPSVPGADADAVILSGTALADFDYLAHLAQFDWISEFDRPLLGICAGMQVIALQHGGALRECTEIGMVRITASETALIKEGERVFTLHRKAAVVPEGFLSLARSDQCVHVIRHEKKPQLGVLFHPEVRSPSVIHAFLDIVPGA